MLACLSQPLHKKEVSKLKVIQLCPTLCDPMDYTVHGILQAGILEWVAFPFSRGSPQPRDRTQVSHIAALQADSLPAEPQGKLPAPTKRKKETRKQRIVKCLDWGQFYNTE